MVRWEIRLTPKMLVWEGSVLRCNKNVMCGRDG